MWPTSAVQAEHCKLKRARFSVNASIAQVPNPDYRGPPMSVEASRRTRMQEYLVDPPPLGFKGKGAQYRFPQTTPNHLPLVGFQVPLGSSGDAAAGDALQTTYYVGHLRELKERPSQLEFGGAAGVFMRTCECFWLFALLFRGWMSGCIQNSSSDGFGGPTTPKPSP